MAREKLKVEIGNDRITVYMRKSGWDEAAESIRMWRDLPPDGYKLVRAAVKTRSSSGSSCNLELMFVHCDSRVDPFLEQEAYDFFRDCNAMAEEGESV